MARNGHNGTGTNGSSAVDRIDKATVPVAEPVREPTPVRRAAEPAAVYRPASTQPGLFDEVEAPRERPRDIETIPVDELMAALRRVVRAGSPEARTSNAWLPH